MGAHMCLCVPWKACVHMCVFGPKCRGIFDAFMSIQNVTGCLCAFYYCVHMHMYLSMCGFVCLVYIWVCRNMHVRAWWISGCVGVCM